MTTHNLKTWPVFFEAIREGRKTFEVRKNDRGFQTGDVLVLRKYNPNHAVYINRFGEATTRPEYADNLRVIVTYVLNGFGLEPDSVVMGIRLEDTTIAGEGSRDDKSQIYLDALAQVHEALDPSWDRDLDDDWDINDPSWVAQQVMQRLGKAEQLVTHLRGLVSSMESDRDTPAWCPDELQSIIAEYEGRDSKN